MSPTNLSDRISEFFTLQGHGLEEYEANPKTVDEAADCFLGDLSFGTAGLRAEMDVGFNRMNRVTVGMASMGLAAYLREKLQGGSGVVVIGHDHRNGSEEFARIAAKVYTAYGHRVKLFPRIVPTPFVPAAIQYQWGSVNLGVMITASHNPRKDNGYKVYAGNGAQIVDEMAKEISGFIQRERANYLNIMKKCENIEIGGDEEMAEGVKNWYISRLSAFIGPIGTCANVRVVYTALHGVGADYVDEIFSAIYKTKNEICPLVHVPQQRRPDPNFPTVDFPNPEEGSATLKMALDLADSEGIGIVFANDPDADRFCVAEKAESGKGSGSGNWRVFNGNEIAILLADHLADKYNDSLADKSKIAMLSSCVSSRFLAHFCSKRDWHHETTPTGFKNLGNRAIQLKQQGFQVLLAYEEAIGFQVGDWNFDKDGITALITFYHSLIGLASSLSQKLDEIYLRESCWPIQCNGYYFSKSASRIKTILAAVKSEDLPSTCCCCSFENSSGVIKIEFELDSLGPAWLMLRSSGTEPKLKYYSEVLITKSPNGDIGGLQEKFAGIVSEMINALIEPGKNNLTKRK